MKKTLLLLTIGLLVSGISRSQATTTLDQNDVSAQLQDEGYFFNNMSSSMPGYEYPAGSNKYLIYSSSFWMAGEDVNGGIKLAAQSFFGGGQDYWSGFIDVGEAVPVIDPFGQTIWHVTQADIDDHILNYQSVGYVAPNGIQNWPVHGDTTVGNGPGMLQYIAPFVDTDSDGIYDPAQGDYPCIKGDEAVYIVMNDKGDLHDSGGDPIGAELHFMFYQYSNTPGLEDVTFIDLEVVNMGTQTLYDFHTSYFIDADVGSAMDDFVGCDTTRNLLFAYNGDAFDESGGGVNGYGTPPPALGVVCLSHNMDASASQVNGSTPAEIYNVMKGYAANGSVKLDGMGNPTAYTFYSDPNDPTGWSEVALPGVPSDRRMLMSTNVGTLTPVIGNGPNSRITLSYAVLHSQGTDNLNSVTELYQQTDFVQNFYDGLNNNCFDQLTADLSENKPIQFTIYPNPSTGQFEIELPSSVGEVSIEVTDVFGRKVFEGTYHNTNEIQLNLNESSGIYLVKTEINAHSSIKRLILK